MEERYQVGVTFLPDPQHEVLSLVSTHDLGDSLGTALSILLARLGTGARVTRDTEDGRHLHGVEVGKKRGEEELRVGSVTARVGDALGLLGLLAAVELWVHLA